MIFVPSFSIFPTALAGERRWEKYPFHSSDDALEHFICLYFSKSTPQALSQFCAEAVKQQALQTDTQDILTFTHNKCCCYSFQALPESFDQQF